MRLGRACGQPPSVGLSIGEVGGVAGAAILPSALGPRRPFPLSAGWPGYAAATGWAGTVVISTRMRMRRWCIPPSIRGQTGAEDPPVAGVRRAQRRPRLHRRGRLADRYGIAESSRHPGAILAGAPVAAGAPGVIPASVVAGLLAGGLADVLPDLPQ